MDCGSAPIVATQRVAQKAQGALSDIVERIRGSPVIHADERAERNKGYVWTFSILPATQS